jgi:hypothetical protein
MAYKPFDQIATFNPPDNNIREYYREYLIRIEKEIIEKGYIFVVSVNTSIFPVENLKPSNLEEFARYLVDDFTYISDEFLVSKRIHFFFKTLVDATMFKMAIY